MKDSRIGKKKKSAALYVTVLLFLFVLCAGLAGCTGRSSSQGGSEAAEAGSRSLSVVTTIFPQYDFVRQIAGDQVDLQMLLKPGEETHSYEPTPQDIIAIMNCDLFIYVGGENDAWVEDILETPEMAQVKTLRLVDCVETVEEEQIEGMQEEKGEHDHEHEEEHDEAHEAEEGHVHEADEHVWTDPQNAVRIVQVITERLCEMDAEHASDYEQNAKAYEEELQKLDEGFQKVVEESDQHLLLFGDRFPFRYFADAYELDYYAAFPGCASDTEPSAATMAFLINKVKEENIPVILKMELSNENISKAIAEATGAEVKVFYSCHNVTAKQFEQGVTYVQLMQENMKTLEEALNGWH